MVFNIAMMDVFNFVKDTNCNIIIEEIGIAGEKKATLRQLFK